MAGPICHILLNIDREDGDEDICDACNLMIPLIMYMVGVDAISETIPSVCCEDRLC